MPNIIKAYCTNNSVYKRGTKFNPTGVVLHSVGCPQPSAKVFATNWNKNNTPYFTHYVIDDKEIYHTMPDDIKCAHVGGPGNNYWLGIEMGEPNTIKYTSGASFKDNNPAASKAYVKGAYENAVWLIAKLCKEHNWDPYKAIYTHNEITVKKLSNTNHVDPEHLWNGTGMPYSLKTLQEDVAKEMKFIKIEEEVETKPSESNKTEDINVSKITSTLRSGSRGEQVRILQRALNYLKCDCGEADGIYGPATTAAVKKFQSKNVDKNNKKLEADGIAGPLTINALNREVNKKNGSAAPAPAPAPSINKEPAKIEVARNYKAEYGQKYTTTAKVNMRVGAGTNKDIIVVVPNQTQVTCYGYYNLDSSNNIWLNLIANVNGKQYNGYCMKKYLK